ncbi:hypothetical protein DNL40_05930 [Xylanimonas oleitrophica]|uniref:Uncharacterized protein n=1 Tax=Xylanimonas oleitrophica TaxID=2607479 RepID=A0A2W5WS61_9MICO|nr:hypothetical protein [Xylanimonas oleitrophica]PZR53672.1 hypothetical protein DNL40_05930 [Xylanimonas oleitrophica]
MNTRNRLLALGAGIAGFGAAAGAPSGAVMPAVGGIALAVLGAALEHRAPGARTERPSKAPAEEGGPAPGSQGPAADGASPPVSAGGPAPGPDRRTLTHDVLLRVVRYGVLLGLYVWMRETPGAGTVAALAWAFGAVGVVGAAYVVLDVTFARRAPA